jgi:hypothetical protein
VVEAASNIAREQGRMQAERTGRDGELVVAWLAGRACAHGEQSRAPVTRICGKGVLMGGT